MFRSLLRRHFTFREVPGPGVNPVRDRPGVWRSPSSAPWFQLIPEDGEFPSGWVLFNARLVRRGSDYNARLKLDLGDGFERGVLIEPPISAKGILHEIAWMPKGIRGLRWEPMQAPGEFEQSPIRMIEIGGPERIWRMVRRIVPLWFKQPRIRRKRVGLTFRSALWNLPEAYYSAGLFRRYARSLPYAQWLERFDFLSSEDRNRIRQHIHRFGTCPFIRILTPLAANQEDALQATLQSLSGQIYRHFSVIVVNVGGKEAERDCSKFPGCSTFPLEYVEAPGAKDLPSRWGGFFAEDWAKDYVGVLPAGSLLSEHALYWAAAEVQNNPEATVIYTDEDEVTVAGERVAPRFKPDWSPEHLRSTNYVGRFVLFRCREVQRAGGLQWEDFFGSGLDLLLRVSEVVPPGSIVHVPQVMYHGRHAHDLSGSDTSPFADSDCNAVVAHLYRSGVKAFVTATAPGCFRVCYALPKHLPLVSLIIPTRDGVSLLRRCVESVLQKSTYPSFEILVVDNKSAEPAALAYLRELAERPRVRVHRFEHPFNFSAINNFAARHAQGDVLCLLNNDTEVISPDWMEEMLSRLIQPAVGVVGAKLYYPDGLVQHAGDAVGPGGCADHLHSMIERDAPGYCNRAIVAQELSAVTAACMMTWKHLYQQVGGLDEVNLEVAFNDVDYCLKIQAAGYRVLWTPYAELVHHESASRGRQDSIQKQKRTRREAEFMRRRWRKRMEHDPYYNPNLNYERPDFSLSNVPRVDRPWERR